MGTRADFYVGRGEAAEWLGSIAWDGFPDCLTPEIISAVDEAAYRKAVAEFLASRDDATVPAQGWPWPWNDSRTTDYAYAFDGGSVVASSFGHAWFDATQAEPDDNGPKVAVFPDMQDRKRFTLGERSGVITVAALR